jgi:hypothetical protein
MRRTIVLITVAAVMLTTMALSGASAFAQSCFGASASLAPGPQLVPGPLIGETASGLAQSGATGEFAPVGVQALQQVRADLCPPSSGP